MRALGDRIITVPNMITLLRILLVFPIFHFLSQKKFAIGLAFALIAFATDFLDGFLSRKMGAASRLGEVMDPLADRLVVVSAAAGIFCGGRAPSGFFYLLALREAIAVAGYLIVKKFVSEDFKIIKEGKTVAAALYILILLAIAFELPDALLYLSALAYFLPFYFYLKQARNLKRREGAE